MVLLEYKGKYKDTKEDIFVRVHYGFNLYDTFSKDFKSLDFNALRTYAKNNNVDLIEFNTKLNINDPEFLKNSIVQEVMLKDGFIHSVDIFNNEIKQENNAQLKEALNLAS